MLRTIRHLLELIRFSHTLFAMPFALLAAVMAGASPTFRWRDLLGILLCMITARSFAMAFNRLADRRLDATNPRTAGRHLPAGILTVWQVAAFAGATAHGFRRKHITVLAESLAALSGRASAHVSGRVQLRQTVHRRSPISGSARRSHFRPWRRGSQFAATPC